ncbi:hypothetical protein ACFL1N_09425 [Thermodesulfobacteriota bacterium]
MEIYFMRVAIVNIILISVLFFAGEKSQASWFFDSNKYLSSSHGQLSCSECHTDINKGLNHPSVEGINGSLNDFFNNEQCIGCHDQVLENSEPGEYGNLKKIKKAASDPCISCHTRHHEKVAHDAHIDIPCGSCHMLNISSARIMEGNSLIWGYTADKGGEYDPHRIIAISEKDGICSRCHFKDNNLGASEHVLPAKSIICMPCHASTFSVGDISSIGAIIIFLIGTAGILLTWLSAGKRHDKRKKFNITDLINIKKTLILDGFFQRRLLKVSVKRWIVHAMIFFPFIFRFFWGMVALFSSLYNPEWNSTWSMLNKNNPITGFLFDLSGMLILLGGCLMVLEKRADKTENKIQDIPEGKSYIHILLGLIIITGFLLEGARIAMTGSPVGSEFAFIGYGISRILVNQDLQGIYIYFWYVHAVITGAFIACLPFSRMFHIFITPLSVAIKAASGEEKRVKD